MDNFYGASLKAPFRILCNCMGKATSTLFKSHLFFSMEEKVIIQVWNNMWLELMIINNDRVLIEIILSESFHAARLWTHL